MKIYITRHGLSLWNRARKVCGATDIDLDDEGRLQAKALGQQLKGEGITLVITSTLRRAMETGDIIAEILGVPTARDARMVERDFGRYEGASYDDEAFRWGRPHFALRMGEGESQIDVAHRVYSFLDEVPEKYKGETPLVVCHGAASKLVRSYFTSLTDQAFGQNEMDNCGLWVYEY